MLHIGARIGPEGRVEAHAWLELDNGQLIGTSGDYASITARSAAPATPVCNEADPLRASS
jgi:hypothetical protein